MLDVFEVVDVSTLSNEQWLVRGRAWQTINIGDIVYSAVGRSYSVVREGDSVSIKVQEIDQPVNFYPFIVTAISTYGKEIEQIGGTLTGNLVVKGEQGSELKKTKLLVMF